MPTGSRRIIEVWPARYSPAIGPCWQRTAAAKKRQQSTIAGISSPFMALIGLPQLSASSAARASASASMRSAMRWSAAARSTGVVADQASKAPRAAATAASTCASEASGTSATVSPVRGFSTASAAFSPAARAPPISIDVCISSPPAARMCACAHPYTPLISLASVISN